MAGYTFSDWIAAAESGEGKAQLEEKIVKDYADRISNGTYTLPQLIADLGIYVDPDANLISVARALALLPPVFGLIESPSKHDIHMLVEYFCARLRNEESIPNYRSGVRETAASLKALAAYSRFIRSDSAPILDAIFTLDNGTQFSSLAPASRVAIFELVDYLVRSQSLAINRDLGTGKDGDGTSLLVTGLVSLVELEKNPSCLGIIFPLYAHLGQNWKLSPEDLVKIWDSFIRYYPITLGGGSRDPAIPTKELLRDHLLQCIVSNDGNAKQAFPYFIDRLDVNSDVSANIKIEVLETIVSCVTAYSPATVSDWAGKLWDSLKFEVWNGENDDFIDASLRVLKAIGTTLSLGPYDFTDHKDPLGKYILTAATECSSRLHDSKKQYALPSGKILHAISTSSPYAFYLVIRTVLPVLLVIWQDLKLDSEKKMVLSVFNHIVSARVEQGSGESDSQTEPTDPNNYLRQTSPKMESAFQGFRDGLVEVYSGVVSDMKRSDSSKDISYGIPAIEGLALLFQLPGYLSEVEMAMTAQELNSLTLRKEADIHSEVLTALQRISASEPKIFAEISLPNFFDKLPEKFSNDSRTRKEERERAVALLQDLIKISCSMPCKQARGVDDENSASSYWHRNFDTFIGKLLERLGHVFQLPNQIEYVRLIIGVIYISIESFDEAVDKARKLLPDPGLEPKPANSKIGPYTYIVLALFRKFNNPKPYSAGPLAEKGLRYSAIAFSAGEESVDEFTVQTVGRIAMVAMRSSLTTSENNFLTTWDSSLGEGDPGGIWSLFTEHYHSISGVAQMDLEHGPSEKCLANVLSTYLVAGLKPDVKDQLLPRFPIGEVAAAMIRNAVITHKETPKLAHMSMLWMLQLLVNKFSATSYKLENGKTLLNIMEELVQSIPNRSKEEVNNIYQILAYFAAASLAAFDRTAQPLINLMIQGISDPKYGRKVAQSFRILLAPSEIMNKENFCKIRGLRNARLLSMTSRLYQSWKETEDLDIKENYLIAYAGVLGFMPSNLLVEDSKPISEGFFPLILSGTNVKNDDHTKNVYIALIHSLLPLCPSLILEHLDSIINRMTERTHNTYDSPSDASVECRALALEVLGRLTEEVDKSELVKRRGGVMQELDLSKDDCSRVVRKRAEQAKVRWLYLED